jgi:hypothetical protein
MTARANVIAAFLAVGIGAAVAVPLRAGGDLVAFPTNYRAGVLYWTQDRPNENQPDRSGVREYWITPAGALEAAKKGTPLPSGTVITVAQYSVKLDADKKPVKDGAGRFVKDAIRAYTVMEKRTGWGSEYAADHRNGEWEYQGFTEKQTAREGADLSGCFKCHKSQVAQDYVFSYDKLKAPENMRSATR